MGVAHYLPQSPLPEVPSRRRAAMARRSRGGAAAGSLLSRRFHPTGVDRRHRVPQQGGGLRPPVHDGREDANHHRRRPEASGRADRPHRRAAHLGLGADPPSARSRHRSRRRSVAGRIALDRLQERLLPARARTLAPVPPALPRRPRSPARSRSPRLPRRPRAPRRQASLRRRSRVAAPLRVGGLRQAAFRRPQTALAYLARYTHRVAISNSRLLELDEKGVTFKWKDYRIKGRDRLKTMTLDASEFIRRFLLHVLPSGFHRIRHYGLFGGTVRADNIERARQALAASHDAPSVRAPRPTVRPKTFRPRAAARVAAAG